MTLSACRECGQQVSTEAATCPHCGVGSPAPSLDGGSADAANTPTGSTRDPWMWVAGVGTVVVLIGGYLAYQHFLGGVSASGASVEAQIVDRFGTLIPGQPIPITAHCPSTVRLHKDKIVDCSITRTDNNKTTAVFITGVDNSGHFRMQVEDPMILVNAP